MPNATSYKIFTRNTFHTTTNKYCAKATVTLNQSLSGNYFDSDSGPIFDTSAVFNSNTIAQNYYVFAYRNGVRSSFPSTQIYTYFILELWPVQQLEYHGGSNYLNYTSVTIRNLYTNQSIMFSSNCFANNLYPSVQLATIGTTTPISNK